jgi:argininosuccinate lyase
LLDLRLFLRGEIRQLVQHAESLFDLLITLSERHKMVFMPGYTHMQAAMPSSFGLWFSAYAESLIDDLGQLLCAYRLINKNPLGSAAGYGTSLPIDRELTTTLLAFDDLNYNSVYAQLGRGRTERVISQAMASFAETLGKLAADCILFMSENYRFIQFPERLTTGSSIMPHKRNPDVFEIIRARCNRIKSLPNEIGMITANLPSGYHRDFQIIKESLFPALSNLHQCLERTGSMLAAVEINKDLQDDPRYRILGSVEAANRLVMEGVPFRDAYLQIAGTIQRGDFKPPEHIVYTHTGSIGNLKNERLIELKNSVIRSFNFERLEKMQDLLT